MNETERKTDRLSCLLCGSPEYSRIKSFDDGIVVGRCLKCGFIYTPVSHNRPHELLFGIDETAAEVLYKPIVEGRVGHFRRRNFLEYLKKIEKHCAGRRLLDVGCAHGFFPKTTEGRGFEVAGIEPSPGLGGFAADVLSLKIYKGLLGEVDLGREKWDVITFTDVLEYFPDPIGSLRNILEHLSEGGLVFLKVPNGNYSVVRHSIERLLPNGLFGGTAFGPSRRVAHFTTSSLGDLASTLGLDVVEVGACSPVDSPVWHGLTGLWLEMEGPWYFGIPSKLLRRTLHRLGLVESFLSRGTNHLSPSIYLLGRK